MITMMIVSIIFYVNQKYFVSYWVVTWYGGGIRKDITLLISSWLPFGQNELCSDGNKMHSNLLQSSEKVRSFFLTIYDIDRFILLACMQNFEFRRRKSDIVLRKRFENLVNYLLLTACPFIQHLLQIRKNEIKNRYIF